MKIKRLIEELKKLDENLEVVILADEHGTYHTIEELEEINLVKGNMYFSYDGREWVEDDGDLMTKKHVPLKINERMKAIVANPYLKSQLGL